MNEINAYKIEKEAREKRLLVYSEEIEKRMRKTSSEIIKELVEERHRPLCVRIVVSEAK